jgi:transposase
MTKQIEVITSVERRRRWSRAEKERLVAAAIEPGAVASEIAQAAGIATSQLFRWRRQLCGPASSAPAFSRWPLCPHRNRRDRRRLQAAARLKRLNSDRYRGPFSPSGPTNVSPRSRSSGVGLIF